MAYHLVRRPFFWNRLKTLHKIFLLSRFIFTLIGLVVISASVVWAEIPSVSIKIIADAIRYEATLPNNSAVGRPLPLAAHWNSSERANGFSPDYQMKMIEEGHYLLPWFHLPPPSMVFRKQLYYDNAIKKAAKYKLPISFISTQWERLLTDSPEYLLTSKEKNPNVVNPKGEVLHKVSPFGTIEHWYQAGEKWTANMLLQELQAIYPDPPKILFVSNNEHSKVLWRDIEQDARYLMKYGVGRSDVFRRKVVGDGWISRYRALQNGLRDGLISPDWKNSAFFVGYDAFSPRAFGRWSVWVDYSLCIPGRIEPWPLAWDGASVSYYVRNWDISTDYTVMSPQIEAMNWVFALKEARKLNPDFWFEISTWDGQEPLESNDKRKYYENLEQIYSPERYEGFVQFGMWLLRPRIVREFRNHLATLPEFEPYFLSVINAVDRVHTVPVLKKFWRRGELVTNNAWQHPYQIHIPKEYSTANRWFLLDTNYDPPRPWTLDTEIPVFSVALVIGKAPKREWLIYAHSPLRNYSKVKIFVPGYREIHLKSAVPGCFYHVIEESQSITLVGEHNVLGK